MDSTDIFRENVRRIIKKTPGLSQKKIASHLGISPSSLNDFLSGRINASIDRMENISKFIGIPFDEMVRPADKQMDKAELKGQDGKEGVAMYDRLLEIIRDQAEEIGKLKHELKTKDISTPHPQPREKHGSR